MKGYILAVAGAVLLTALLSALLPEGKMGKLLRGIAQVVVFTALLTPLSALFFRSELPFAAEVSAPDEGYLAVCARMLEEADGREIEAYLEKEFSVLVSVQTTRRAEEGFALEKITLIPQGIIGQDEHINRTKIAEALETRYGAEVIWTA